LLIDGLGRSQTRDAGSCAGADDALRRHALASRGPVPRRAHVDGHGSAGAPEPLLLRRGRRRGLEERERGPHLGPIFDSQPIASIGAIAVAPSDPNVIYVGSGEADMRSDISYGNGMYKSVDAGKTWTRIGLTDTRQIGRILVDARDPNLVFVAALGHGYGPNRERGVFRSKDGGKTWTAVLFKDENTGAIDLAVDPSNGPKRTILAALWQTRRPPWNVYPPSNGPGSGLYRSEDGGDRWEPVILQDPR
jgi:hypothetical protein